MNWTEQCAVLQRLHVPVILVFQSVCFSSKRHNVFPPFEIVVHGLFVPGILATRQPAGIGTWQCCEGSPLVIPKLQACSVVAGKSDGTWAFVSDGRYGIRPNNNTAQNVREETTQCMRGWYHSVFACGHRHDCVKSRAGI
jgi:hypothetical protein